jgi:predicted nucleic acid-binding protein
MAASFFDTNILLYLASADVAKADRAEALLAGGGVISVQVLNEVANVCRRKMRLDWAETRMFLQTLGDLLEVRPLTLDIHLSGLRLAERYQLSVYDALIVAAALEAGCTKLWSEDMQHAFAVDGQLQVLDPFTGEG